MIAAETLLAIYPQAPHEATMWDFMPRVRVDPLDWASKSTEDIMHDLGKIIAAIPPACRRSHPYVPAHYHAINTHWQREQAEADLLKFAACTLPMAEARKFVRRASAANRLREAEHYAAQGVIIDL